MPELRRSGTETLISSLEDFGKSEPRDCIVIYTNDEGDLCWNCTSDSFTVKIGLVEAARTAIKKRFTQET